MLYFKNYNSDNSFRDFGFKSVRGILDDAFDDLIDNDTFDDPEDNNIDNDIEDITDINITDIIECKVRNYPLENFNKQSYWEYLPPADNISKRIHRTNGKIIEDQRFYQGMNLNCEYSSYIPDYMIKYMDFSHTNNRTVLFKNHMLCVIINKSNQYMIIKDIEEKIKKLKANNNKYIKCGLDIDSKIPENTPCFIADNSLNGVPCNYTEFKFKGFIREISDIKINAAVLKRMNNFNIKHYIIPENLGNFIFEKTEIPFEKDLELYPENIKFYFKNDNSDKIKTLEDKLEILKNTKNIIIPNDKILYNNSFGEYIKKFPVDKNSPDINIFIPYLTIKENICPFSPIWKLSSPWARSAWTTIPDLYFPYNDLFLNITMAVPGSEHRFIQQLKYKIVGAATKNFDMDGVIISINIPEKYYEYINKNIFSFLEIINIQIDTSYGMSKEEANILMKCWKEQ